MGDISILENIGVVYKTNKSGGVHVLGDVCVEDPANANSVINTTTEGYADGSVWVCLETVADDAVGKYAVAIKAPQINLDGSASLGDLIKTSSTPKMGTPHAPPMEAGDFAAVMGTGTSPAASLFGAPQLGGSDSALVSDKNIVTAGDYTGLTSTSFVDLDGTNLSITLNTGARRCRVEVVANGIITSGSGNNLQLDIDIDGVRQGEDYGLVIGAQQAGNLGMSFNFTTDVLSAGSHTFKVQYRVDSGTGKFYASTSVTPFIFSVFELQG